MWWVHWTDRMKGAKEIKKKFKNIFKVDSMKTLLYLMSQTTLNEWNDFCILFMSNIADVSNNNDAICES